MINKKKLFFAFILIFLFSIILFISFYFSSTSSSNNSSQQSSPFSIFNKKKPLKTFFLNSPSLSSTLSAYQLSSLSIHEVASFIQDALAQQFSLVQQTATSFTLDISSLSNDSYLEGCNNGDYDEDEEEIELSEEESVPGIEINENDTSYRSHCAALAPTNVSPITELETAEVVFQNFASQHSFAPYFTLANFIQTSTGFTALYSYANDQNYALIYQDDYFPLTINFDQIMHPTTLSFAGQFLPVINTDQPLSLTAIDSIITKLNQKQISPVFQQDFIPKSEDYFSIAHINLIYYFKDSQYLPYYQMSGRIVDRNNSSTGQVFTFITPALQ